jgi:GTP-binding protein Era
MEKEGKTGPFHSGYVSIIGRPNTGKSTLLNAFLGQKISIVTKKPQTTRNRILGIKTLPGAQVIFIDTPGFHEPKTRMGEFMLREAREALKEVDAILLMVEPRAPGLTEKEILGLLKKTKSRVLLVINKIDTIKKPALLPVMDEYSKLYPFGEIVPVSALRGEGIEELLASVIKGLPEGPKYYPDDLVTDQLERFMVSEIIREKLMEATSEEVPHAAAVDVLGWEEAAGKAPMRISADIWVEREGQKGIIIGKGGRMLKAIGTAARGDIEKLLNERVFLDLRVKLRKDWRSDARSLSDLGLKK